MFNSLDNQDTYIGGFGCLTSELKVESVGLYIYDVHGEIVLRGNIKRAKYVQLGQVLTKWRS